MSVPESRRGFLWRGIAAAGGALLSACDSASNSTWVPKVLASGEKVSRSVQRAITGRRSMAQEFTEADLSPSFRSNGTYSPEDETYQRLASNGFREWKLRIDGQVTTPQEFSLADLRAMNGRTQITRHDCVEGWSAIAKWTGVPLTALLERVKPLPAARYVVFHCGDPMDEFGTYYYESIDLEDAYHPQTILAYDLNGQALPVPNGAPLRARIERQLGYKQAKYIMRIELVNSFARINGGKGGYWEDLGYEWYAGI